MNNKPSIFLKILFVILLTFSGFIIGSFLSTFFIPKNVGLAGGAMVVMYGIVGMGVFLLLGLIMQSRLEKKLIRLITLFAGLFLILFGAYVGIRIATEEKVESSPLPPKVAVPTKDQATSSEGVAAASTSSDASAVGQFSNNFGLGMAKPKFNEGKTVYFLPNADATLDQSNAIDSITFKNGPTGPEIATAPPWLVPEHLKLDYQVFWLKVKSRTDRAFEVVVNKTNGQTGWIPIESVDFYDWSAFLLTVFSVESLHPQDYLLRIKPMDHASPLNAIPSDPILQPKRVQGEWIEVEIFDQNMVSKGKGWLRWKNADEILIKWNLFS